MRETGVANLVDLLSLRARKQPERWAYSFLADGEREEARLGYAELDRQARAIGARLQTVARPDDRVLLLLPSDLDFVAAFFGCLYAGVVAVPAYPPRSQRSLPRLLTIVGDATPTVALTTSSILSRSGSWTSGVAALRGLRWLTLDDPDAEPADDLACRWRDPGADPDRLAFLQYTSGSTAAPKGVMVSHGNLLHNQEAIRRAFGQSESSVIVGWLPLFHDMGLIGNVLQPLYVGAPCVLMSPAAFLQKPLRWLSAIDRYRATTSGGPNFAYELCSQKISPEQREGLDLSSWKVAFNGAEPVRAETLASFATAFAPQGFRREAFFPCYGLAEATLFAAGRDLGAGALAVDGEALELGRVAPAAGERMRHLVSCGTTAWGQEVRIVEPESGRECPADRVGEIWLAGPSVARGYWNRPEETAATFGARLAAGESAYLRTGDLGFARAGELFVTGRLKDLVILRGRNHYPQDLEQTAERADPALRAGCGAAFSIEEAGEERLVIVWELDRHARLAAEAADAIAAAVRQALSEEHEVQLLELALLRFGALPKTTSGKVRRQACRASYLAGELAVVERRRLAVHGRGQSATPEPEPALDPAALAASDDPQTFVERFLQRAVASVVRVPVDEVDPGRPISHLGLDSLAAVELQHLLASGLGVEVPAASLLLRGRTLAELARTVLAQLEVTPARLSPPLAAEPPAEFALSLGQRAVWFLHELAPESVADHIVAVARVLSPLDVPALRRACRALVIRHPALRTTFHAREGEPRQRVSAEPAFELAVVDAALLDERQLEERLYRETYRRFDLEAGPLLRIAVFALPAGTHALAVATHHIVGDFQSLAILARELGALYAEEHGGPAARLAPARANYADYVAWQQALLAGPAGERLWEYWRERLAGAPASLSLPTDRPRPAVQTYAGASESLRMEGGLAPALRALAGKQGCTLFTVLLATFQALLQRYSGQDDVLVGSPAAGRVAGELAVVMGYFINPLALRTDLGGDPSCAQLFARAGQTVIGALEHQEYPFPLLAERLHPERDPSRSPIYQVVFGLQQAAREEDQGLAAFAVGASGARVRLGALELESMSLESHAAQLDLTLYVAELAGGLVASLRYNSDLFDRVTARRVLSHFHRLLAGLTADAGRRVSALPMLSPEERFQLVAEWSAGPPCPPGDRCLHELIEEQVRRTPAATALVHEERRLTFEELNRRANRLAHHLRRLGVDAEERVGVFLGRTPEMVMGLLAVLKAGGAYVPLDPGYPTERLRFMLEDSRCAVLLTEEARLGELGPLAGVEVVSLDRWPAGGESDPAPRAQPGNLAYVMYTSGSTGKPKGVAIEHHSPVQLVHWTRGSFPPAELAGVLFSTSICFDLSIFELMATLALGGMVILAENALALPGLATGGEVTLVNTVPSAIAELAGSLPPGAATVTLCGEPLKASVVRRIYLQETVRRVYNLYGPSEATTYSTVVLVPREEAGEPSIGRPLADNRVFVLDPFLELAPVGSAGELYLGGDSLARGYLDRPALTAERFLPHPFSDVAGARLYRTGDLVRFRADGELEHLGRADSQVKVRGFRIELGEVEAVLARHPSVHAASVVLWRPAGGEPHLVAYMVPGAEGSPAVRELRAHLAARLPEYMVPSFFVTLDALPLTPNGKVDRRALPPPERRSVGQEPLAPRTVTEELLLSIWAEVLGLDRPGVHDNFFDLGGHSLLATRIASRVRQVFGVDLPLQRLFELPTAQGLARFLDTAIRSGGRSLQPALLAEPRPHDLPLSYGQERLWFLHQLAPESSVLNIANAFRLSGGLDAVSLAASLGEICRRHEVLRTRIDDLDGVPRQTVLKPGPMPLPVVDLGGLSAGPARGREMQRLADAEVDLPFDLSAGRPFRALLLRACEREHVLVLTLHHLAADGGSLEILLRELAELYEASIQGRSPRLPAAPLQFADYALWQRRCWSGEAFEPQLAFWRRQLAAPPPAPFLPGQRERPATPRFRGEVHRFELAREVSEALRALARTEASTLFMTLFAAFSALIHQLTGQDDLLIGTNVANRGAEEIEGAIGYFVNNLALRADLSGEPTFRQLVGRIREMTLAAYAHQDVPFERVVADVQPLRQGSYAPLFKMMFVMQSSLPLVWRLPGLDTAPYGLGHHTANFDLMVLMAEDADGLLGAFLFDTDLFEAAAVARMVSHFEGLLASATRDADQVLGDLDVGGDTAAVGFADPFNEGLVP
jgi:amino acid adenylation domain-containing protein